MFNLLLHRTTKDVIPRRDEAPTWESPGTMFVFALLIDAWKQEIATSRYARLAMTCFFEQHNVANLPKTNANAKYFDVRAAGRRPYIHY